MQCPVCQRALANQDWARCPSCRLTWASPFFEPDRDRIAPWPLDERVARVWWPLGGVLGWIVTLPIHALAVAAVIFSVRNVLDGARWWEWVAAAIGVPLGALVGWVHVRGLARWLLHVFIPDRIEVTGGAATVRLRGEDFVRSEVSFSRGAITSVRLTRAQGEARHVWLQHQSGLYLLVGTLPADEATSFVARLTA